MSRLVIVSNRVPAPRDRTQLAGGLAVALRDAIEGRDTLWFGWSGKSGPAKTPQLVTKGRISFGLLDLPDTEYRRFYNGFSNGMLWPLLHGRLGLACFSRDDWKAYQAVNEAYATALMPLLQDDDLIWVHDYHLFPLGAALRACGARQRIGFFLHVPFPPPASFAALPRYEELIRALAEFDVIGVQTRLDAAHLNGCLTELGLEPRAQAFPIGIDPDEFARCAAKAVRGSEAKRLVASLGGRALILGVDRLDYSKGIPQRLRGYAQFLKRFPEHRRHVTFLQVAPVSRGEVAEYRDLRRELDELVGRITGEHAEFDWAPIRWITQAVPRTTLAGFHRLARVGLVTPLRDGMNLVAKEYVAAQDPHHPGALVLSRFAGAADDMEGSLLVNPHDPDEIADALHQALTLNNQARMQRWRTMHGAVHRDTAAIWARRFLAELGERQSVVGMVPETVC